MTQLLVDWLAATWEVLALSGPWLLVGFVLAGIIRIALPEQVVYRHLGKDNWRSVFTAAVMGVPLPLCSCSVLPTAMSLRKSGASKGASTSFLISTPETGVDSIGITWALMDPVMTIVRPIAALVTALGSGLLVNLLVRTGLTERSSKDEEGESPAHSHSHSHSHDHDHDHTGDARQGLLRRACHYAFGPLLDDLTPWFLIGLALSGLIGVAVPDGFFASPALSGWTAMLAMLVVGVPMYVCATASTPIAAALVAKGLDPGAALIFLLAGPATNLATIAVVRGFLGTRVLVAYLLSIAGFSLGFGTLLGPFYAAIGQDPSATLAGSVESGLRWHEVAGGLLMVGLLLRSAARLRLDLSLGRSLSRLLRHAGIRTDTRLFRLTCAVAGVLAYALTGIDSVRVGETGFLTRFGRVLRTVETPGLVSHWPYPFEALEVVRTSEILGAGTLSEDDPASRPRFGTPETTETAIEIVTGDETLIQVPVAVHYTVSGPYRHRYGVADSKELVVALLGAATQRAASTRSTSELLVDERAAIEGDIARMVAEELHAVDAGLEVLSVQLGSTHAPASVHEAFRDVASALEDRERSVHDAEAYRVSTLTKARGAAATIREEARSEAVAQGKESEGRAAAFAAFLSAYLEDPESTALRLQVESLPRSLKGARVIFRLGDGIDVVELPTFALDEF